MASPYRYWNKSCWSVVYLLLLNFSLYAEARRQLQQQQQQSELTADAGVDAVTAAAVTLLDKCAMTLRKLLNCTPSNVGKVKNNTV